MSRGSRRNVLTVVSLTGCRENVCNLDLIVLLSSKSLCVLFEVEYLVSSNTLL